MSQANKFCVAYYMLSFYNITQGQRNDLRVSV